MRVLIPGFGVTSKIFSEFKKKTRCIIIDNPHSYSEFLKLWKKTVKTDEPIDIFGWSLGSIFALKLTLENRFNIKTLFLTGATARFLCKDNYKGGVKRETLLLMKDLIKKHHRVVMYNFFMSFLKDIKNSNKIVKTLMDNLPSKKRLLSGLEELERIDLLEEISNLRIPLKIIQGEDDKITPIGGAEEIIKRSIGSILEKKKGNHALFFEYPGFLEREWLVWTS